MATTTPSSRGTSPPGDAEPHIDLRRALSGLVPILIGLLVAEFVFARLQRAGRRFGERHPFLAEFARRRG